MEISTITGLFLALAITVIILVHFGLRTGLKRLKYRHNFDKPLVSIIVAARNEEQTIGQLLQCLLQQTYTNLEILIVNDRSSDRTANIISDITRTSSKIKKIDITSISEDMPAKKNALRAGIQASNGEVLCFTDADCFPPPTWIEELVKLFEPDVGLVAGYSPYLTHTDQNFGQGFLKNLFFMFIAYEEFRSAVWSAGSIGWNLGWLCTGRNLAYRKKVYSEVNGFEKIKMSISGDDDLFLQLVRRETSWKVRYLNTKESFVPTIPPNGFISFIEQRKRHFSAAKFFTFPMKLFFLLYHSSNLLLFISPIFLFFGMISLHMCIICIITKVLADSLLYFSSARIFESYMYRHSYAIMEVLYIFYNLLIGPLGLFGKFGWKQ